MTDEYLFKFDATFWITIGGMVIAFGGLVLNTCLKSKCKEIKLCWGLFNCVRDIEAEVELEEVRMSTQPQTPVAQQVISRV